MELAWESAGTDDPGDQNADSDHGPHSFWSLGRDGDGWSVELIVRGDDLEELPADGLGLGRFRSEVLAKRAAQSAERRYE